MAASQTAEYDLELHRLTLQLNRADFLQPTVRKPCRRHPEYKVHSNGADKALSVCVILQGDIRVKYHVAHKYRKT